MIDRLAQAIIKMKPWEFLGLCTTLGVKIYKEEEEPKEFPDLLEEVLFNFQALNRKDRRKLLRLVEKAVK